MDLLTSHQQKALNFNKHISLTANAGSGKTFVLSRRYLEIALSEKGSLRKIAAITFTDKAAGELYKKIADQVEIRFNKSEYEDEKKILNRIRRQLVSANISTIHSFCTDILRQFPVEAGLDANFQAIDETTSDELIELSVEEIIRESLSGNNFTEDTRYLVRFFRSKFNLALQLRRLIKDRKKVFDIQENIYDRSDKALAELFHETFVETVDKLIQINRNEFTDALSVINESVLSLKGDNDKALEIRKLLKRSKEEKNTEARIGILLAIKDAGFTKGGEVRKAGYLSGSLREGMQEEIRIAERYISDISSFHIPQDYKEIEHELARFGLTIIRLFNHVVKKYDLKKKESGYLDYEDILILTKNLLKIPAVRAELTRRFKYIMVDEYQDTNEIQYKIFLPILDNLREGNLFVVGDEKQSIYMFRDADLEVFRITKEHISNTSGKKYLLSLPDSFRMAPGICLFVNKVFSKLFSNANILFNEVEHTDLVCAKKEETDSRIEILIGASENIESSDEISGVSEAELVAQRIISLVNGTDNTKKLNWKDIAVLVRKRKSFSSLEKIFIEKNIPFNIVGGKGFYKRQPVYDIYNYFSFLLDSKNDTALVGILRSPFFTVPDSSIYELFLKKGETLWEKLIEQDSTDEKMKKTAEILKTNIRLSSVYSASRMLRRIFSESPYLSVLAQKASGNQETANMHKLIKLTIDFQSRGYNTLYDYVNFLRESIEKSEDEAQAAIADESNSVKVMTLHQAKGLEYPAVFLYNAHEVTFSDIVRKGSIQVDKSFGLMTKVPLRNDYFGDYYSAPICNLFDFISSKKETAEIKRLLYVGTTRAKNYLFISAPDQEKYKAGSFMGLLQESLNIDFTQDGFTIEGELGFLKAGMNKYSSISQTLEEGIKITRNRIEPDKQMEENAVQEKIKQNLIRRITDYPKGEIISASKFATFKQCPLKYHLTYELGISGLIREYRDYDENKKNSAGTGFDFSYKEDITEDAEPRLSIPAEVKGSIIHKILQTDNPDITPEEIGIIIRQENRIEDSSVVDSLQSDISARLKKLFDSHIYQKLRSYKKSFNEYEIYLYEEDYFLHGILDKFIIEGNKATIIDYKTDSLRREEIYDRASLYFPQLKFYSYIVSRLFKKITSFELRIVFINFPSEDVKEIVYRDKVIEYGEEIRSMIGSVRVRKFDRNLLHCKECTFALKNLKCIVERA